MNQSKQLTDGALLTAVFIILMLISAFVPVISIAAVFLLPVPFVLFASRYDWKPSIVMLLAAIGLSVIFTSIYSALIPVLMGIGGIMIGRGIYRKYTAYETLASGTIGFVAGLVALFLFSQVFLQVNLINEMDEMLQESLEMSQNVMGDFGLAGQTEEQMQLVKEQLDMLIQLIPVWVALIGLLMAFISQWVSYKIIGRLENRSLHFPPFRTFRLPVSLIWIYLFALIISFIDLSGLAAQAVNNVLMLTGIFMALQGLSFIFYYAHEKNKTKALPVISVILTIFFPFIFLYLVRLLGIIDIGFALRDRISNGKT
ncbi:DUF2232 domain-containing protein [Lentibacillus cibarius]|uniref:DUF2232 domain-containing protein n=1 Tax=Lentibacillus cibarius TaxID=2583219 RepID=A0A549YGL2_9BACI|nr:YybS family protein [Lentibacillus cibarius]TRM11030.1 DUF2232 domain-containing protein [Lentibacillus cibarius]